MAEMTARDAKLIQYLNEAYGKEKELETALQAHISMTTRAPYKKRLQEHLRETKRHAKDVERRIKQLGGKAESVDAPGPDVVGDAVGAAVSAAKKGMAAAKGPMHMIRGTGEQEKMLKNAKTEFFNEAEEIANYNAIEALATQVGDKETAKLAKDFRRQEERMASFLEKLIPQLTRAVAQDEIPAAERKPAGSSRRSSPRRSSAASSRSRSTAAKRSSSTTKRKPAAKRSTASRSRASGSRSSSSRARRSS